MAEKVFKQTNPDVLIWRDKQIKLIRIPSLILLRTGMKVTYSSIGHANFPF